MPAYAAVVADPEVMRYLGEPRDADYAESYVADCIERDRATGISRYAVLKRSDGAFLGYCGFKALDEDASGQVAAATSWTDFGWQYRRADWGKGYGSEAALAVYAFGRRALRLENLEIRTHRDNAASLRIIEKLGFQWLNDYETAVGVFRRFREPV